MKYKKVLIDESGESNILPDSKYYLFSTQIIVFLKLLLLIYFEYGIIRVLFTHRIMENQRTKVKVRTKYVLLNIIVCD